MADQKPKEEPWGQAQYLQVSDFFWQPGSMS